MSGNDDVVWYLRLNEEDLGSVLILTAQGRVFAATVRDFAERLAALDARQRGALILDFAGVDYINSQGLRVLEEAADRANAAGSQFIVCGLQPPVKTAFDLAGSAGRMAIEPSREDAIRRAQPTRRR